MIIFLSLIIIIIIFPVIIAIYLIIFILIRNIIIVITIIIILTIMWLEMKICSHVIFSLQSAAGSPSSEKTETSEVNVPVY